MDDLATAESQSTQSDSEESVLSEAEFLDRVDFAVGIGTFALLVQGIAAVPTTVLQLVRFDTQQCTVSDGRNYARVNFTGGARHDYIQRNSIVELKNIKYDAATHTFTASDIKTLIDAGTSRVPILRGELEFIAPAHQRTSAPKRSTASDAEQPAAKRAMADVDDDDVPLGFGGVAGITLTQAAPSDSDTIGKDANRTLARLISSQLTRFSGKTHLACLNDVAAGLERFFVGPVRVTEVRVPAAQKQPWKATVTDTHGHSLIYITWDASQDEIATHFELNTYCFIGGGVPRFSTFSNAVEVMFSETVTFVSVRS